MLQKLYKASEFDKTLRIVVSAVIFSLTGSSQVEEGNLGPKIGPQMWPFADTSVDFGVFGEARGSGAGASTVYAL